LNEELANSGESVNQGILCGLRGTWPASSVVARSDGSPGDGFLIADDSRDYIRLRPLACAQQDSEPILFRQWRGVRSNSNTAPPGRCV